MAKIICGLPNASALINGVRFISHKLGMISEEISEELAAEFVKIKGYILAPAMPAIPVVEKIEKKLKAKLDDKETQPLDLDVTNK